MNKNDVALQRIISSAEKFGQVMNLLQHALTMAAMVGSIYLIFDGLGVMVKAHPESLRGLSSVIEKMQINAMLGYVVAAGTSVGWVFERRGKKRALRIMSGLRKKGEQDDPYNPSSELDEDGQTPK